MNFKTEIRAGIVLGVSIFLWLLLEFFLGFHTTRIDYHPFFLWLIFTLPFLGIYWTMRSTRNNKYAGEISFIQALKSGLMVTLVMSILSPIMVLLYVNVMNPLFLSTMLAHSKQMIEELNISVVDKEKMIEETTQFYSTLSYIKLTFLVGLISGIILSLLTATLMRRKSILLSTKTDHSVTETHKN